MNDEIKGLIFEIGFFVFIGVLIISIICTFIKELKKRKKDYENLDKPIKKASTEKVKAKAINKYSEAVYSGGYKNPNHQIGYFITFETQDGNTVTFDVGEEQFKRIKAFTTAYLVTSEGEFIDFK